MDPYSDIAYMARVEHLNGFGFQCDDGVGPVCGTLALAFINGTSGSEVDEDECTAHVLDNTASTTFRCDSWIGRAYIAIHLSEWDLIPAVVECLIATKKYYIRTINKLEVSYGPDDATPDFVFTWPDMERRFIAKFKEAADTMSYVAPEGCDTWRWYMENILNSPSPLLWHWNYCTPQGKAFCTELRTRCGKTPASKRIADRDLHLLWWGARCDKLYREHGIYFRGSAWSAYEPSFQTDADLVYPPDPAPSPSPSPSPTPEASSPQPPDPAECLVCMDAAPSTTVSPCGHACVCQPCSAQLGDTADASTCVQCRCPITGVTSMETE